MKNLNEIAENEGIDAMFDEAQKRLTSKENVRQVFNELVEFGHGGKRPNAGRKPKYKEATTTVAFRLPVSIVPEVKKIIAELLKAKTTANPLE